VLIFFTSCGYGCYGRDPEVLRELNLLPIQRRIRRLPPTFARGWALADRRPSALTTSGCCAQLQLVIEEIKAASRKPARNYAEHRRLIEQG